MTVQRTGIVVRRAALTVAISIALWSLYQVVLDAPSRGCYPMVALCFVAVPAVGAVAATRATTPHRPLAIAVVWSAIAVVQLIAFVVGYVALPYYLAVERVDAPAHCDGTYTTAVRRVAVGDRTGILLQQNPAVTVAAVVDRGTGGSTVYVIRRHDHARLFSIRYPDDTVAVAVDATTVFIFNDALGTLVDARTGRPARTRVTLDSVGPNHRKPPFLAPRGSFETTGYFSIWWTDGSVRLLEKITFNGIQDGCFIDGRTNSVRKL